MEIYGYTKNKGKEILVWVFYFLTVGILRLFFFWFPHLMIAATHSKCSLKVAVIVVLKDQYDQYFVSKIKYRQKNGGTTGTNGASAKHDSMDSMSPVDLISYKKGTTTPLKYRDVSSGDIELNLEKDQNIIRFFVTKKVKYVWNTNSQEFEKAKGLDHSTSCAYFHEATGLSHIEQSQRRNLYGNNSIQIHVTPIITLLFKEVLSPFYIFQLFSCSLWYADEYYWYATAIVIMSVASITVTIYQTRQMQRALRNTIDSSTIVTVDRGANEFIDVSSDDLVPGDVIEIPRNGCVMQCDAVLVAGNCIVNESMLTGESVPVTKTPLPNPKVSKSQDDSKFFNLKEHSRHVLFCGTHVIQTRYYGTQRVRAVVLRTGFTTAKGELVRSIMYPKPVDFKFNKDTYIFVGALAAIAGIGFIYTIVLMAQAGEHISDIIIRSLDLITIAVPPALPAALTIGIVFAQQRLKKQLVYCISPRSINVSGSISAFCFDKTGTLTEDGLDLHSVVPVENSVFSGDYKDVTQLDNDKVVAAMATCHSLTLIDNVLSGDPLDLIMFEATGWELLEEGEDASKFDMIVPTIVRPKTAVSTFDYNYKPAQKEIGIIRQFTFSSSLQRMSVIARTLGSDHFDLYAKGAPEKILMLSKPETIPDNFHDKLMLYTQHGYRVLALAWRPLPGKLKYPKLQRIQREQVEKGLTFLGFLVTENRVKPETTPVIKQLIDANIRPVMVTGDNMLTALSVAKEIGMVPRKEKIVLIQGYPQFEKADAYLEFVSAEEYSDEQIKSEDVKVNMIPSQTGNPFHFAVDGRTWSVLRTYFPDLLPKVCVRGTVFARFSPEQKGQLVETLQDLGYYVGMCGDGANDCGALKTAHAGISLSEAEASVASPFTSKKPNIECVPTLIREGRAALTTSSGIFKYMAMYSLTQFLSVCILYWVFSQTNCEEKVVVA